MAILDPIIGTILYGLAIAAIVAFARIVYLGLAWRFRRLRSAFFSFVVFVATFAVIMSGLAIYRGL